MLLVNDFNIKVSSVTDLSYPSLIDCGSKLEESGGCESKVADSVKEVKNIMVIDWMKSEYFWQMNLILRSPL